MVGLGWTSNTISTTISFTMALGNMVTCCKYKMHLLVWQTFNSECYTWYYPTLTRHSEGEKYCKVPYFLDQTPPSSSRRPRIVATSYIHLCFIVTALELSPHFLLEPIGHTHKQCPHVSLAVLLASQVQKRSYDDAFKLKQWRICWKDNQQNCC